MSEAIQVVTTTSTREDADRIAAALVERRLAACVQVGGPIISKYRWQGKLESTPEWTCTVKTLRSKYEAVERAIRMLHTYDEPEILALPVVAGSEGYLRWLTAEVGEPGA